MKTIKVTDKTYEILLQIANESMSGDITRLLKNWALEEVKIVPTKEEKKEWKENLYNTLCILATDRPQFAPRKKDSLNTLLESFLYWAEEYNDGYFSERDEANTDKYCAWLVQEYDIYNGEYYK